jgi:hypothetical protein
MQCRPTGRIITLALSIVQVPVATGAELPTVIAGSGSLMSSV